MFDLKSKLKTSIALNNGAITSNTTTNGSNIDQTNFSSLVFSLISGAYTNGTYKLSISESDDGTNFTQVDADNIIGDIDLGISAANSIVSIGVVSKKKFVRASIVSTSSSGDGANLTIIAQQSHSTEEPVT